jgi:hypothetical protein
MERVIVIRNESPLLLICPHGRTGDDDFTAQITETIAENIDCSCVINQGWKRGTDYDYATGRANCNNVDHLHKDVVKEEMLDPIMSIVGSLLNDYTEAQIVTIHGMGRQIRKSNSKADGVVGYGDVKSPSCELWRKNGLLYCAAKNKLNFYQGKQGGFYSGASRTNLNQLYRKWYNNPSVHSIQLELVKEIREDQENSDYTAEVLSCCLSDFLELIECLDDSGDIPKGFDKNWESIGAKAPEF